MITVAGFNTAIDRRIVLDAALRPGAVQRAVHGQALPGGKGLHVAQMVAELGEPVRLVGLVDTLHGEWVAHHLESRHVEWHGVETPHALRQCLALHEADGRVTEILEPGPELDAEARQAMLSALRRQLDDADMLVVSGSLPRGFAPDTCAELVREASDRGLPCLMDASGEALRAAVGARPWLVKPNAEEAASLLGRPVESIRDAAACAWLLHRHGVRHAVVTLAGQGAVGCDGEGIWHASLELESVRNGVGSGDCFMAGLAVALVRGDGMATALRLATACGGANAGNEETGFASRGQVQSLLPRVCVRPLPAPHDGSAEGSGPGD